MKRFWYEERRERERNCCVVVHLKLKNYICCVCIFWCRIFYDSRILYSVWRLGLNAYVRAFTSPPLLSILKKYISVFIETISFNIYYILLTFCKSHAHMFSHISLSTLTFVVYKYIRFTFWCFKYFFKSKIITNLYQYQCSMFTHTYIYKSVIPLCLFHFDIIRWHCRIAKCSI